MKKLNNILYKKLWPKKGICGKIIYIIIPFIMLLIFWFIIDSNNAYRIVLDNTCSPPKYGYGFLDDYSNRYVAFGVFIFVYFARGLFTEYSEQKIDLYGRFIDQNKKENIQRKRNVAKIHMSLISIAVSLVGIIFIYVANSNGEKNWYSLIGTAGLIYYSVLITCEWKLSIDLFVSIIIDSFTLMGYSKYDINNIDLFNNDRCCGFRRTLNVLSASLGCCD